MRKPISFGQLGLNILQQEQANNEGKKDLTKGSIIVDDSINLEKIHAFTVGKCFFLSFVQLQY